MKKRIRLNFWHHCELIPPIKARLLARIPHGRPLTDVEIAKASGLSADRVLMIQNMCDWSLVSVTEARAFLVGCGIDFCDGKQMDRVKAYLPREGKSFTTTWKYLRISPDWHSKYEPLFRRYLHSLNKK